MHSLMYMTLVTNLMNMLSNRCVCSTCYLH